jgi:autotransporter passenger strand-loop-strand repeat protein
MTADALPSGGTSTGSGITLNAGDSLTVLSGGTAVSTTVNSGGEVFVSSGGIANTTTINANGFEFVFSSGSTNSTTVSSGGIENVDFGGTVNGATVTGGGFELVSSGGTASGTIVDAGGQVIVFPGGEAVATVQSGGLVVSSGVDLFDAPAGATFFGRSASDVMVGTGQQLFILPAGTVTSATVSNGGIDFVYSGGTAIDTTVNSGGTEAVEHGGTASGTTINASGTQTALNGAATINTVVNTLGTEDVLGSATATHTVVNAGGELLATIGGITIGSTVNDSGQEDVGAEAVASGSTVNSGGAQNVFRGGVASNTIIDSGGFENVSAGSTVISALVKSGGFEILSSGGAGAGVASDTVLNAGAVIDITFLTNVGGGNAGLAPETTNELTVSVGGQTYTQQLTGDYTGDRFALGVDNAGGTTVSFSAPPCFRHGTRLLTDRGDLSVEALAIGDRVVTWSRALAPIVWIGHRQVDCARHPDPKRVWPVRVAMDAFGQDQPRRDLFLSPDHAVFVDGLLIPVRQLINGTTIAQLAVDDVIYHHVELERHDVLFAEGLAAESYLDTGNRMTFANGGGAMTLHPDFNAPKTWRDDAAAPLGTDEARVRPVWERLAARSRALGRPVPDPEFIGEPAVHLRVDGRALQPVVTQQNRCVFVLPPRAGALRLVSRSGHPTDKRPWADDRRRLGIYVTQIVWHDLNGAHGMPIDHPALGEGWWDLERDGHILSRWTNGDALLPLPPTAIMLEVQFGGGMAYRAEARDQSQGTAMLTASSARRTVA